MSDNGDGDGWTERILRSYQVLGPRSGLMTELFYDRLFEVQPDVRPLFSIDMQLQRQHLAASLALIVRNLRMLDTIEPSLRTLGTQHARAGVCAQHYPIVRDAMLYAMSQTLGDAWNDTLSDDWSRLLDVVARQMLAGETKSRVRRGSS
jgi:nitric oxide dioxygenase